MRTLKKFYTIFFIILFTAGVFPQEAFEGRVEYKISSGDETTSLIYFIKDNMIKMDVQAEEKASMIFNTKNQTMLMMMPEQKMYMEMPVNLNPEKMDEMKEMDGEFKQTGETKDILGYSSEKWIYKEDGNEVEAWLTQELGSFMFMSNPMGQGGSRSEWESKLAKGGYFPLLVIAKEGSDEEGTKMEVTAVEKKSLSEDMFRPPADYQKLDMPGMNQK